jgi:hypothetical protein
MDISNTLPRISVTAEERMAHGFIKRYSNWDAGERKAIKRSGNRRNRRADRITLRNPANW